MSEFNIFSLKEISFFKDSQLILDTIDNIKTFSLNQDNVSEVCTQPIFYYLNGCITFQLAFEFQLNSALCDNELNIINGTENSC